MSKELNHKMFSPTDCLSEGIMFDYIDNKLTPKERHLVEKNLLSCEMCSDAMEGLEMLKDRKRIDFINQKINERIAPVIKKEVKVIFINYRMISGIAAGLLLLVGGVFFFNNFIDKEIKQNDIAEFKQLPPVVSPAPEKTITDSEEITTTTGKDEISKLKPGKTKQQNQLTLTKEEKPKPDFKTSLAEAEKNAGDNLKQEMITKSKDEKNAENIPLHSTNDETVLLETDKNSAPSEENSQNASKNANNYTSPSLPAAPPRQNDKENRVTMADAKKREANQETSRNARYQTQGKKDKSNKREEKQMAASQTATAAPQAATGGYEQPPSSPFTISSASVLMPDSLSVAAEPQPQFPGGKDSLNRFIKNHFNYPSGYYSFKSTDQNKITLEFTVDKTGKVKNPKINKGINTELNNEALRVVNSLPIWIPANSNGKSISATYHLQINLDSNNQIKNADQK